MAIEGETVTPGTKVAVISKSDAGTTHVAPSEEKSAKDIPKAPPAEVQVAEKKKPAPETPVKEKPKAPSPPPPRASASEPQLPPKERERRVSLLCTPMAFDAS